MEPLGKPSWLALEKTAVFGGLFHPRHDFVAVKMPICEIEATLSEEKLNSSRDNGDYFQPIRFQSRPSERHRKAD